MEFAKLCIACNLPQTLEIWMMIRKNCRKARRITPKKFMTFILLGSLSIVILPLFHDLEDSIVILQDYTDTKEARSKLAAVYQHGIIWLHGYMHLSCVRPDLISMVELGEGGGLGSMIQMAAKKVVQVIGEGRIPVFSGHYRSYTRNAICSTHLRGERICGSQCFFEPLAVCDNKLVDTINLPGSDLNATWMSRTDIAGCMIPINFSQYGRSFWYGVVQGYMVRLNSRMTERVQLVHQKLGGQPFDIAVHLRLGDKLTDADSRQSRLSRMPTRQIVQLFWKQVLMIAEPIKKVRSRPISVYLASDTLMALNLFLAEAADHAMIRVFHISTKTQNISGPNVQVMEYVEKSIDAYELSEELIIEMSLMMKSTHFVGICMSQIARMVEQIGKASGTLRSAVAIDYENIPVHCIAKFGREDGWTSSRFGFTHLARLIRNNQIHE